MWEELVRERHGVAVASLAEAATADLEGGEFVVVLLQDEGILPAVAALDPPQAAAYLALAEDSPGGESAGAANRFLESLARSGRAVYLLKSGRVGGSDPERSIELTAGHVATILDAIAAATIDWELDPDFGYRVAAAVPGIEGRDRFILVPRFLYARTERVYEYAALVPALKRERLERLSALERLDAAIIDAVR